MIDRETLARWDNTYVWHPFTPHSVYPNEDPLMVVAGEGHYLIDDRGRRFLDGVSSLWCNLFGHRRSEIDTAVSDQLAQIAHSTFLGNANAPAVHLAKRLIERTPAPLNRVFFSDNGSTAVEVALKMAYQFWQQSGESQRTTFLTLGNAYHGDTVGSVSLGNIDLFHERYRSLLFDTVAAPSPHCYRSPLGLQRATCGDACVAELEELVATHGDTLAAVVMEPGFQGASGIIPIPEGYLKRVRQACDRVGALLILDEVAAGFGRTGHFFACDAEDVVPDLMCVAKGLTGGYLPMAATFATERIYEAFLGPPEEGRTFFHGHTYTGNQLGAAAAHAVLDIFEKQPVMAQVQQTILQLRQLLESVAEMPWVGDVRQQGLAVGIEIVSSRSDKTPFSADQRMGMKVCLAARDQGVFLRPLGDVIVLMPR